jgi:aconitate hydratase
MKQDLKDSFGALTELIVGGRTVHYFRLQTLEDKGIAKVSKLPFSIKVLLEAVMRAENGYDVTQEDVRALAAYDPKNPPDIEVPFKPSRVLLQDFTGVPAVVDLAAMRSAVARMGGDPNRINPAIAVNLVVDHSIQIDVHATADAASRNTAIEFERNKERYEFLSWGQKAFQNFTVVPPGSGICHQVNLEYLAKVVQTRKINGKTVAFPDTLVGTDSHTTMINGLGVVGWGVGGIEAEAAMLEQPLYMLPPKVLGVRLEGTLPEGSNATDLVLKVTEMLRKEGVVGKFVEFFGPGMKNLPLTDRATVANMAPEYGATMGFFPVDEHTLSYLRSTGRPAELIALVEAYCKAQGLFYSINAEEPVFEKVVELDLAEVKPSVAGPKRPQDRVLLSDVKASWKKSLIQPAKQQGFEVLEADAGKTATIEINDETVAIGHGTVAIASISSCTNTSNPSVMLAAGLLAKKAVEKGLIAKPWVKTSLAPGSLAVTEYLKNADLLSFMEKLGFHVVGYGCATCIGNSGPLVPEVTAAQEKAPMVLASVVSSNRNFEGRIHPLVRASYLCSPPLVVAYALAGTVDIDLTQDALGTGRDGKPVYLKDIWPKEFEIQALLEKARDPEMYRSKYTNIETSNAMWNAVAQGGGEIFNWSKDSNYIQEPPFFIDMKMDIAAIRAIKGARVLAMLGDTITTDHISPAGSIAKSSPAGKYLMERGVEPKDFNSLGARRGNHEVMMRGTFANIRLKNLLAPGTEGGWTRHLDSNEVISIYDASMRYQQAKVPVVVLAGKLYGMGSSRDWAAKGQALLGVKAVIAESYERIHRSNLVGMGVLPLEYKQGESAQSLGLSGEETFDIEVDDTVKPRQLIKVTATSTSGARIVFETVCRLDTIVDVDYLRNGGILHTVLRNMLR